MPDVDLSGEGIERLRAEFHADMTMTEVLSWASRLAEQNSALHAALAEAQRERDAKLADAVHFEVTAKRAEARVRELEAALAEIVKRCEAFEAQWPANLAALAEAPPHA